MVVAAHLSASPTRAPLILVRPPAPVLGGDQGGRAGDDGGRDRGARAAEQAVADPRRGAAGSMLDPGARAPPADAGRAQVGLGHAGGVGPWPLQYGPRLPARPHPRRSRTGRCRARRPRRVRCPPAVTTVMPPAQTRSTASVSGAVAGSSAGAPSDRFSTLDVEAVLRGSASWMGRTAPARGWSRRTPGHLEVDQVGTGRDPGGAGAAAPGDQPGHEGAVPVAVGEALLAGQVGPGNDPPPKT